MSGAANLIATQLCPRDAMVFRSLCDTFYRQVEVPKRLCILGTERAELFLSRNPGHIEDLTILCDDDVCGFHKVLPYIGSSLKRLDIRYRGTISLAFLEFLPRLEDLSVSAKGVSQFPCFPKAPWGTHFHLKRIKIIATDHIVLPAEFAAMYPHLESFDATCYSLGCGSDSRFPLGLKRLAVCANSIGSNVWVHGMADLRRLETFCVEGARVGHIPPALGNCPDLKTVVMRDLALSDTAGPDLHLLRHVEHLDLSDNETILTQDIEAIEVMDDLEVLDLRGCFLFDMDITGGRSHHDQRDGAGSASLATLHLSTLPPRPWLSRFQNLERLYIHPSEAIRCPKQCIRAALDPPRPVDDEHEAFRTVYVPESDLGSGFTLHVHRQLAFSADDLGLFAQYFQVT